MDASSVAWIVLGSVIVLAAWIACFLGLRHYFSNKGEKPPPPELPAEPPPSDSGAAPHANDGYPGDAHWDDGLEGGAPWAGQHGGRADEGWEDARHSRRWDESRHPWRDGDSSGGGMGRAPLPLDLGPLPPSRRLGRSPLHSEQLRPPPLSRGGSGHSSACVNCGHDEEVALAAAEAAAEAAASLAYSRNSGARHGGSSYDAEPPHRLASAVAPFSPHPSQRFEDARKDGRQRFDGGRPRLSRFSSSPAVGAAQWNSQPQSQSLPGTVRFSPFATAPATAPASALQQTAELHHPAPVRLAFQPRSLHELPAAQSFHATQGLHAANEALASFHGAVMQQPQLQQQQQHQFINNPMLSAAAAAAGGGAQQQLWQPLPHPLLTPQSQQPQSQQPQQAQLPPQNALDQSALASQLLAMHKEHVSSSHGLVMNILEHFKGTSGSGGGGGGGGGGGAAEPAPAPTATQDPYVAGDGAQPQPTQPSPLMQPATAVPPPAPRPAAHLAQQAFENLLTTHAPRIVDTSRQAPVAPHAQQKWG